MYTAGNKKPACSVVESTERNVGCLPVKCKIAKSKMEISNAIMVPSFSSVKRNIIPRMIISATKPAVNAVANEGSKNETGLMFVIE